MGIIMKKISVFFLLFSLFPAIITFAQEIQQGNATWYEDDSHDLNASHARLPPGTRLRVTNLNNQKEVYVTVTDRIQNSDNRILDVSQEAASLLGMNKRGYTPIRLVVIRGLAADPPPSKADADTYDDYNNYGDYNYDSDYDSDSVPEITAVSTYPDEEDVYENDEEYKNGGYDEVLPMNTASAETPPPPPPPVRAFPQQPASQAKSGPAPQAAPQAAPVTAAQSEAPAVTEGQVLLKKIVVIINGKEQTIDIPEGVYIPLPAQGSAPSTPAYPSYPPSATLLPQTPAKRVYLQTPPSRPVPVYPPSPPPAAATSRPAPQAASEVIKIIPKLPDPNSGKVYRVQVGAYSNVALARACFERLKAAGFSPAYEQNGSLYRVVLSGIRAADMSYTARCLNAAGFTEAWLREESRP